MSVNLTLKKLGLNEKEVRVYLALLRRGKTKPAELAKLTKLNRATLYHIAKGLVSSGIIAEDLSGKTLQYVSLPINDLKNILESDKRALKEKEDLVKRAVGELRLISSEKSYPVPKIRFIEEKDLEKFLFDNLVKWQKNVIASDGFWWGFQDHTFVENYPAWIAESWKTKESQHKNYLPQVFTNDSAPERRLKGKYQPKRHVKFLADTNFTATTWVCGNYIVMIHTRHTPFYLIEIHDEMMALNMREIFRKLWEIPTKEANKL
ncbi:MAG: helix-turn-helix domain-containing protein [Parcubacteria group bacterium]|jgi:sugar-specific transcriptional regulator TrmB